MNKYVSKKRKRKSFFVSDRIGKKNKFVHISRSNLNYLLKLLILFFVYLLSGRIGATIATEHLAAAIWIPSGIALTSILLFGYKFWPAIALGEFVVNWYLAPLPPDVSFFMAVGNTIETLLAVYILKRNNFSISLCHHKDVILLILVAMFCTIISATLGVSSLYLKGIIPLTAYLVTWKTWWVANTLSIIIIPPLILTIWERPYFNISKIKILEILLFTVTMFGIDLIVFHKLLHLYIDTTSSTYLVFPPLIWAALRFGVRGTVITIFLVTTISILETARGLGPFVEKDLALSLLSLQTFIGTVASTIMILASVESERKEMEERKDEFISIASHELKTPLTSIQAYSQILLKTPFKNNVRRIKGYMKKMNYQVNNMGKLINGLLDISRIQTGRLELHKKLFSLDTLVFEIVDDMLTTHQANKIIIKKTNRKKCNIFADKEYITQVIVNLLTNAIKYSSKNGKIIVNIAQEKNNTVKVSIQDYGIGMTQEEKDKIFDKYYRVSAKNKNTISGLGIGLYISNEIIKMHSGKLAVASTKGKGSKFSFHLPMELK